MRPRPVTFPLSLDTVILCLWSVDTLKYYAYYVTKMNMTNDCLFLPFHLGLAIQLRRSKIAIKINQHHMIQLGLTYV